jgi:predicted AAA+ superfamily ATPase
VLERLGFAQFLTAIGHGGIPGAIRDQDGVKQLAPGELEGLQQALRLYLVVGGIPAAVETWLASGDMKQVDRCLDDLLASLLIDNVHLPTGSDTLWRETASQMGRENSRFNRIRPRNGVGAWEVEHLIEALLAHGCAIKIHRMQSPDRAPADRFLVSRYKHYPIDTGLFRRMAGSSAEDVLHDSADTSRFRGTLTELYVLSELMLLDTSVHYWKEGNLAEVDFIAEFNSQIIPIEVKTSINVKSHSLAVYRHTFHPPVALRYSMLNIKLDDDLLNIPLPLVHATKQILSNAVGLAGKA